MKSLFSERFIRALKSKISKKMIANNKKVCLSYFNKLVDEYSNTYHHSFGKKHIDADYSALNEKLNQVIKLLNIKLVIKSELLRTKIF